MNRYSQNNKYLNPFLNAGEMPAQDNQNPIDFYNLNQKNKIGFGQNQDPEHNIAFGMRQVRSDDQEMDLEPAAVIGQNTAKAGMNQISQGGPFSYVKVQKAVKSHVWSQRA